MKNKIFWIASMILIIFIGMIYFYILQSNNNIDVRLSKSKLFNNNNIIPVEENSPDAIKINITDENNTDSINKEKTNEMKSVSQKNSNVTIEKENSKDTIKKEKQHKIDISKNMKRTEKAYTKKQIEKSVNVKKDTKEKIKEKSIYDYKFNIDKIKSELIRIGESMGLKHRTMDDGCKITPQNSSWGAPVTASQKFQGKQLERGLKDYVKSMPEVIENYGGEKIEYFTIYVENHNNESYTFYFLY